MAQMKCAFQKNIIILLVSSDMRLDMDPLLNPAPAELGSSSLSLIESDLLSSEEEDAEEVEELLLCWSLCELLVDRRVKDFL